MNHDSLAQIPINSVLIGLFTEALNTITTPGTKYPEYITINGSPATNTSSRTYKFKSADVRTYLEGLQRVIETTLTNFIPEAQELTSGTTSQDTDNLVVSRNESGSASENDVEIGQVSENDDAVAILDEEPSSSETGETLETPEQINEKPNEELNVVKTNNVLKGGSKRSKTLTNKDKNKKKKTIKR